MIIHANVKSKAFKRGWEKIIKRENGDAVSLRDFCGALHLDCENNSDAEILTAMYQHVFRFHGDDSDKVGSIKVFDAEGKEVAYYYFAPPSATPAPEPHDK